MPRTTAKKSASSSAKPVLEAGVSFDEINTWFGHPSIRAPPFLRGSLKHANVFRYIVTELRAFLRTNGLPVSGRKADLIERILEHLSSSEASEEEEESGKTDNQRSHSWESEEEKEEENDEPSIDHNQEESEGESDNDDDDEESDEPEPYVSDPDFAKLLRKLGSGAQDRGSPVPMQHLNQFQQKLGNNVQGCKIWLPDDLRQLYRFANGFKLELEDVSEVLPLDEVSDAPNQGTKTHHDLPLERCHMDDEDDVEHPAWIPFAMNGDYECYLVNANYGARTYGQVYTVNLYGDDKPQRIADSIFRFFCKKSSQRQEQ